MSQDNHKWPLHVKSESNDNL